MTTKEFFQLFWYAENWDLTLNLIFLGISVLYLLITGPFVSKIPGAEAVPVRQKVFFLLAMIIYYSALGSPINLLAHELFSMHMLQMSILFIVLPPFLLLGIPAWMLRPLLRFKALRAVGSFFTKPLIILFVFNGLLSLYHIPVAFNAIMGSHLYHYIAHFVLLIGAIMMWWPVICPIPELDRVKPLHKLAFIFANGILLTPVCALVIFADRPLFELYQEMSTIAPIMQPIEDQQLGGVTMKIVQEIVYISAIGIVMNRWLREQREQDERELQEWKETQQKVASV